jgi:hypothetical protein
MSFSSIYGTYYASKVINRFSIFLFIPVNDEVSLGELIRILKLYTKFVRYKSKPVCNLHDFLESIP